LAKVFERHRMALPALMFSRFVVRPENASARAAVEDIRAALLTDTASRLPGMVMLHGPPGSGKSHLVAALADALADQAPRLRIHMQAASALAEIVPTAQPRQFRNPELAQSAQAAAEAADLWRQQAASADLLIVQDVQHVPMRAVEVLIQVLDERQARGLTTLVTSAAGPRHLTLRGERCPARLASRLAAGLVVAVEPLQAESRLCLLRELAQRRQLAVAPDILAWLAERLTGGGRQLEGAIRQLDTLAKLQPGPLTLADVQPHFQAQVDATQPSLQRIMQHVGDCFAVPPRRLQSRQRTRNIVLPRQVGMYLARRLTQSSLQEIGAYFGGHDHTTVLHACRKIEQALDADAVLSGTVRQLQMELT
jgi:chromosomal replication initiator protein